MTVSEAVRDSYRRCVIPTYAPALTLTRGRGSRVWDADGKVYLDFASGIAVNVLGHAHPRMLEALRRQAAELIHVSNLHYNAPQAQLAEKLSGLANGGRCFFCNSGAEANEGLIKLARLHGNPKGRYEIVSMRDSFHGRTLATMAATGQERIRAGYEPMPDGFAHAAFNDIDSVRAAVGERTAAILVEAIQGEGGVRIADPAFLSALRSLCDERGMLLLCDEVQCGLGRTGRWFGFEHAGIAPDAFALAKSLGGGYPIGAVVARPDLAEIMRPGGHASTFGGSPLACAVALAVIETIEDEDLVARAAELGASFKQRLANLAAGYARIREVRGLGFMLALEADRPIRELAAIMTSMGLITVAGHGNVLRFLPALTVPGKDIDEALEIVGEALAEWHGTIRPNGDATDEA